MLRSRRCVVTFEAIALQIADCQVVLASCSMAIQFDVLFALFVKIGADIKFNSTDSIQWC